MGSWRLLRLEIGLMSGYLINLMALWLSLILSFDIHLSCALRLLSLVVLLELILLWCLWIKPTIDCLPSTSTLLFITSLLLLHGYRYGLSDCLWILDVVVVDVVVVYYVGYCLRGA